jgi:biofilm PGA synthesis N-glycosyltransferase PgaC
MAEAPASDLIVTFDADCVPRRDALRLLAAAFADQRVGAAGGLCTPSNALASIVSRYSSLEFWVHHLVNLSGKDFWRLSPVPSAAIAAYRRDALVQVGGFLAGVADDVSTTFRILGAGYTSRYVVQAVVESPVVTTLRELTAQRRRWSANLHRGAVSARGLETLAVASGYLDRVLFAVCVLLAIAGVIPWLVPVVYLSAMLASILTALVRAGYARRIPEFLAVAVLMAPVDLWLSLPALGRDKVLVWNPPGRSGSQTR